MELGIASRTTVASFFNGRPVDRLIFQEICEVLDLEWSEIVVEADIDDNEEQYVEIPNVNPQPSSSVDRADLIDRVNKQGAISC